MCMRSKSQSWFSAFGLLQVLSGGSSSSAHKQSPKHIHQEASSKQSRPAVAHVVAPCPHDGKCPMEGTKSWCHFAQRFQRSDLQRRHKVHACCNIPDHMSQDNHSTPPIMTCRVSWTQQQEFDRACSKVEHQHLSPNAFSSWPG